MIVEAAWSYKIVNPGIAQVDDDDHTTLEA
jgi:hypothetical protein